MLRPKPEHDPLFIRACQLADAARTAGQPTPIAPTARQYAKWRRGEGSAYRFKEQAKEDRHAT